jgi:hypothetical protein
MELLDVSDLFHERLQGVAVGEVAHFLVFLAIDIFVDSQQPAGLNL